MKVRSAPGPIESEVEATGETSIDDARGARINVEAAIDACCAPTDSTDIELWTAAEPINGPMELDELEPARDPELEADLPWRAVKKV